MITNVSVRLSESLISRQRAALPTVFSFLSSQQCVRFDASRLCCKCSDPLLVLKVSGRPESTTTSHWRTSDLDKLRADVPQDDFKPTSLIQAHLHLSPCRMISSHLPFAIIRNSGEAQGEHCVLAPWWSITKTVLAACVLKLTDLGAL